MVRSSDLSLVIKAANFAAAVAVATAIELQHIVVTDPLHRDDENISGLTSSPARE